MNLFNLARGSGGNAILPEYFGTTEANLAGNAKNVSAAISGAQGSTNQQLATAQNAIGQTAAGQAGANTAVNNLMTGQTLQNELGYQAPVNAANTALAKTQSTGILEGLNDTLNKLNAANAAQGFTGGSSFANNQALGATIGARQQAAGALAGANLQNAQANAGLQIGNVGTQLANVGLPGQLAAQNVSLANLPETTLAQNFSTSLAPYQFFNIGTTAPFQQQNLPIVQPNSVGAALANSIGAGNNAVGNYLSNQALVNQLTSQAGGTNPNAFGTSATGVPYAQTNAMLNEAGTYGGAAGAGYGTDVSAANLANAAATG